MSTWREHTHAEELEQVAGGNGRYHLRQATLDDIPVLARHRRLMIDEIVSIKREPVDACEMEAMERAYKNFLRPHMAMSTTAAWVIESAGQVVASGCLTLTDWPPYPGDTACQFALLHSMYTEPEHRRCGLARRIISAAIDFCKARGIKRITLAASDAGRDLYESMGFTLLKNQMRLIVPADKPNGNGKLGGL